MVRIVNKKFSVGCLVVIFSYLILVNYAIWIQGYVGELIYVKIFCKTIFPIRGDIKCQDIPNGVPSNAKKKA